MSGVSYKKLWKMLIDKDMKKRILGQQLALAHPLWRSWVRMRMLLQMCLYEYVMH